MRKISARINNRLLGRQFREESLKVVPQARGLTETDSLMDKLK